MTARLDIDEQLAHVTRPRHPASLALQHCITATEAAHEVVSALAVAFTPAPWASAEHAERFVHADLPRLTEQRLWQEARRAEWLLAWCDDPDPWLSERWRAIKAEQERRKAAGNE
jgi:hypothetical protein